MRTTIGLALALSLTGCAWFGQAVRAADRPPGMIGAKEQQVPRELALGVVALPGGLDDVPVFNSNSPEIVTEPGITLSTLAGGDPAYQDVAFAGRFSLFSHHIAKDAQPGDRLLRLGLVAHNPGSAPVTLQLTQGASWLSQPDALFKPLDAILPDDAGEIYAGPGDRVATDLMHGRSPMGTGRWTIPAGGTALVYDLPIPTSVAIPPPINGRTTYARFTCSGPLRLSEAALFAPKAADGTFLPVALADFQRVIAEKKLAGPRDLPGSPCDPNVPVPPNFKYGRVAGVAAGDGWRAPLDALVAGLARGAGVGLPIATVFLNKLGTTQVQSAPMKTRYADTAYQAHGNYGVTYVLTAELANPDATARTYALTLSHPSRVAPGKVTYLEPPNKLVSYRGPIRVATSGGGAPEAVSFTHVVCRSGELLPPFTRISVPAGARRTLSIQLAYPADATPPQLLTIARE